MSNDSEPQSNATPPADTTGETQETLVTPKATNDAPGEEPPAAEPADAEVKDAGDAEGKTSDPPAFEPLTAESLTAPEGFDIQGPAVEQFLEIVNKAGGGELSPADMANEFLALHAAALQEAAESANTAWQEQQDTWVADVQKEFGSDLAPKQAQIEKVIAQFGDDELRTALALTGAGNHPAFFRFFAKLADQFTEAGPVQSAPGSERPDVAQRLYPSMKG